MRIDDSATATLVDLPSTDADFSLLVRPDGTVVGASRTVTDVLGWDLGPRRLWSEIVAEADRFAVEALLRQTVGGGSARMTLQLPTSRGAIWVDAAAKLVDAEAAHILITARDVSHDWEATTQLAAAELQWRVAFEHSPIGGALLDRSGSILVVNEALLEMTGWQAHQLTRMRVHDIVGPDGSSSWLDWWDALLRTGEAQTDRALHSASGDRLYGRITAATLSAATLTSPGWDTRVVLQVEDITSRREAELELANRALNDALTGAPNRFLTRQWLVSALEENPGRGVGVLYCDLDRFKIINDSLGHGAGDALLVQVVDRLRDVLRPEDLLGRVGGDEFVAVLEDVSTPAELAEIAQRLSQALVQPFDLEGHLHAVSLSLGGTIGDDSDTADEVLMRADMALLRAKRLGRSRYVAFDPAEDHVATKADLRLEQQLRLSLDAGEIRAFYQPIVSLGDTLTVGHEALMRWQHPEHGLLPPARFLELAETSGLIRPLGWWMLDQACADAITAPGLGWIAVNASAVQLSGPGVAAAVHRALETSGLDPMRLHLEITETALLRATETLGQELHELRASGVKIALDDFGTGYSSLSLLRRFPVDILKIDRSFVHPLLADRGAFAIVKAMLAMCADMGITTVAEGIETEQQRDALYALGCTHGQGYLFGHAAPTVAGVCPTTVRPTVARPRTSFPTPLPVRKAALS